MQSDPSQVAADQKEHRHHREEELAGAAAVGVAGYETYEVSNQPTTNISFDFYVCVCVCMCVFVNRFCKDLSTSKIYNFVLTVFFDLVSLGSTSRKRMIKDSNSLQMVAIHRRRHRRRNTTASSGSKNSLISKFLEIKTVCT